MQKFLLFAVLTFVLASCSNVGKYKEAIESLSGDWDSTTNAVVAIGEKITTAQNSWNTMQESMVVTDEMTENLGEDVLGQITELVAGNGAISDQFGDLSKGVFEFVSNWEEKGKKLTELKEGLAGGKLPGDVQGTIDELTNLVSEGKTKVSGWEEGLASAQAAAQSAMTKFKDLTNYQ